jgi:diacylglycerol kinase family enzyme
MNDDASALLKKRVVAVLNTASGGCDERASGKMRTVLDQTGLTDVTVVAVTSDELAATLDAAVTTCDVLILLGGDGTIRVAADKAGAAGIPLIPLPGGTMNMLAHALYGPISWEEALSSTLADPELRTLSGGKAGGRSFYCVAILGKPALWADAREALRRGDLVAAVVRSATAIRRSGGHRLRYRLGDTLRGEAEAVAVICPLVSRSLAQDDQVLEAAALDPETASEAFRLAMHAMFDNWRFDPAVALAKVTTVNLTGHGRIPVILDGELMNLGRAVTITFHPEAFRAITPAVRA